LFIIGYSGIRKTTFFINPLPEKVLNNKENTETKIIQKATQEELEQIDQLVKRRIK